MFRTLLTLIGILDILSPEKLIHAAERIALENPDECRMESWVVPVARAEGVVYLFLAWRSDASYSAFKKFLGIVGLVAVLYPRRFTDYSARIAYVDAERCSWRPWVYPGTRLVGLLYVLLALNELRKR
ncbi:hypothetical protein [Halegenticoccus tardaugens]|uniref:hypothetical protein n=1 Tax=Halegenticoccus tardaugens TaxID=2071624 RepID=UPI00100A399A|nr:hypothetical protein [Halegenticoccus tardaugens]